MKMWNAKEFGCLQQWLDDFDQIVEILRDGSSHGNKKADIYRIKNIKGMR